MTEQEKAANEGGLTRAASTANFADAAYQNRDARAAAANDAENPAANAWGHYYQQGNTKNESWLFVSAADWPTLQQQRQPLYATALQIEGEFQPEAAEAQRYRGDAYFDWDCKSADEFGYCINDVNQFLDDLQQRGVNLNCLRIYATGGRGFHVEIPWGVYSTEKADKGVQYLPHIYREMARQLFGRYLDLSIYSAKRGRMWRQPGVQRENGNYKVPITLDEMRTMTPGMYAEICNAPRPEPERAAPELAAKLAALFDTCHSRVASSVKKPTLRLFKLTELPDTLAGVMAGKGLKADVGFNQLAMQLALAAHALGWSIDDLLSQTAELRAGWKGDTHTTAGQCADELRRMFAYTADNAVYAYAPNAIRALLADTSDSDDLAGAIDLDEVARAKRPDAVAALAELNPLEFDAIKKDAAGALGVGATALADEVGKVRRKQAEARERAAAEAEAAKEKAGTLAVVDPEPEPWPEQVDGAALLSGIAAFIRRYVYASEHIVDAAALWVVLTHAKDAADALPIAHITAPQKRCGKSTLLGVLAELVCRPLAAVQISPAALSRTLSMFRPTLLLDEFDQTPKELKAELTQLLNGGHTRTASKVIKLAPVDNDWTPVGFDVWGPKVLSGIGKVPDTIADRSIRLRVDRQPPGEAVASRYAEADYYAAESCKLRRQIIRWAADSLAALKGKRPEKLSFLHDRAMDNWATMLAIADVAGGAWPDRARAAARHQLELFGDDGQDYKTRLLEDIREIFKQMADDRYEAVAAQKLLRVLCENELKPWATFNGGKPLTLNRLGDILREFGVSTKRGTAGGKVLKDSGQKPALYFPVDFEKTFEQYLATDRKDAHAD